MNTQNLEAYCLQNQLPNECYYWGKCKNLNKFHFSIQFGSVGTKETF